MANLLGLNIPKSPLSNLPTEIQLHILSLIDFEDAFSCFQVCKLWQELLRTKTLQRYRYLHPLPPPEDPNNLTISQCGELRGIHLTLQEDMTIKCAIEDCKVSEVFFDDEIITSSPILNDPIFYPVDNTDSKIAKEMESIRKDFVIQIRDTEFKFWLPIPDQAGKEEEKGKEGGKPEKEIKLDAKQWKLRDATTIREFLDLVVEIVTTMELQACDKVSTYKFTFITSVLQDNTLLLMNLPFEVMGILYE
ncbi:hypothetical protein ABW19_dt0206071 [Dactylella cylindrospora]|nr:hypothetical protein ABW19_dt0206071 [Dactylella cylindrospora]